MRENKFNIPDKDHNNYINFKTVLKDISIIIDHGLAFNGRFKRVLHGQREHLAYYVGHECGCSSYRTIVSIKRGKSKVCGDCTYEYTRRQILDNTKNYHAKKKDFYESLLIEGAKVLDVIRKKDKNDNKYYVIKFKCACGAIAEKRPADITRYYKPKSKSKTQVACRDCGHFIGHNYGDYAPIKSMIKRLENEVANVTEQKQDENN